MIEQMTLNQLTTLTRRARQRRDAETLCTGAATPASRHIADVLAFASTGCECAELTILNRAIIEDNREFLEICAPDWQEEEIPDLYEQIHASAYGDDSYL